jgi:hypothetical protein
MKNRIGIILLATVLLIPFFTAKSHAGDGFNVAGLSMGRNFVASSRGLEAIGTNPANLALGDGNRNVSFTIIPPLSLSIRSDFIDYDVYNEYFTGQPDTAGGSERVGKHLTAADKERVLSIFPSGIAETHMDLDFRVFGLTIYSDYLGSFGLAWTERVAFNFDLPRDLARVFLEGLDSLGSTYNLGGTSFRGWWLRELSLSYARKIPDLAFAKDIAAGIGIKLIQGYAYTGTDNYSGSFGNEPIRDGAGNIAGYRLVGNMNFRQVRAGIDAFERKSEDITPFPSPAGSGLGFDLGVTGEVLPGIRAALSITDIGSITWRLNTREIVGRGAFMMTDVTKKSEQDSLKNAFKGKEGPTGEFSTPLATSMRIGGSVQLDETGWTSWFPGAMLVAVEYHQGFNDSPGNSTRPRVSLGAEYRPIGFLPLRSGISIGGIDRFHWAMGFGLDFTYFTFDLGTGNIGALFTNSFQQFSFGMGMQWKI